MFHYMLLAHNVLSTMKKPSRRDIPVCNTRILLTHHVLSVEDWVAVPPVCEHDPGVRVLVAVRTLRVRREVGDGVLWKVSS